MGMISFRKRCREEGPRLDEHMVKFAAAHASPFVVSLVTTNVPEEMVASSPRYYEMMNPPKDIIFFACGLILECTPSTSTSTSTTSSSSSSNGSSSNATTYLSTVLSPASIFKRPHHIPLSDFQIDVYVSDGVVHRAKLLACHFHFNLALVTFLSDSPLSTVTLKPIDDTFSIHPHQPNPISLLRPHSHFFKLLPATPIVSVWRSHFLVDDFTSASATFCSTNPSSLTCNELYELTHLTNFGRDGAPALNSFGETIGIIFSCTSFLPSNTILRWWNHYKTSGEFRRPYLGMEVANLHEATLNFLAKFIPKFPNISTAVIVTKVDDETPASRSGICANDVIVKINGKQVQSKIQFYERVWRKNGKSVNFTVARVKTGEELTISLVIEEATLNEFNEWQLPNWRIIH